MKKSSDPSQEKFQILSKYLEGDHIMVHLKPNTKGASLPQHLMKSESVTLKFSKFFRGKIEIFQDRIEAELLFSGTYFTCIVPLDSIWGITSSNGENAIWPDDSPSEILKSLAKQESEKSTTKAAPESNKKSHLKRIK